MHTKLDDTVTLNDDKTIPVKDERNNLKSAALVAEYDVILKVLKDVNFIKVKQLKF